MQLEYSNVLMDPVIFITASTESGKTFDERNDYHPLQPSQGFLKC